MKRITFILIIIFSGYSYSEERAYCDLLPFPENSLNAILQARIEKVIFGAYDLKGGAISLGYHFHKDKRLNHSFKVIGGIMHYECSKILSQFFKEKRSKYVDPSKS